MKEIKLHHPTERMLIFIIMMFVSALIAVLWFYGERINILWQQSGNNINSENQNDVLVNADIRLFIQTANKSLYRLQPVTDPLQNRVYLPEAHIYLPMTQLSRDLVYFYAAATKDTPEELQLSTSFNTNSLPVTFKDVPCLQRFVSVGINSNKNLNADSFVGNKKLDDGRNIYIFKHDNSSCIEARWQVDTPTDIANLLLQARSY